MEVMTLRKRERERERERERADCGRVMIFIESEKSLMNEQGKKY